MNSRNTVRQADDRPFGTRFGRKIELLDLLLDEFANFSGADLHAFLVPADPELSSAQHVPAYFQLNKFES